MDGAETRSTGFTQPTSQAEDQRLNISASEAYEGSVLLGFLLILNKAKVVATRLFFPSQDFHVLSPPSLKETSRTVSKVCFTIVTH